MEIFSLVVSMITTILILTGNTYDSGKKKWHKRPTKLGWGVLCLTLALFGANLFQALKNKRENLVLERTHQQINNNALDELVSLINVIELQNKHILFGLSQKDSGLLLDLIEKDKSVYRTRIDTLNLLSDSGYIPKATWAEVVTRHADGTKETLDKVSSKYGDFLDPKIRAQVIDLSNHPHLQWASALRSFLVKPTGDSPTEDEIRLASQIFRKTCYSDEQLIDFLMRVKNLRINIYEARNQ